MTHAELDTYLTEHLTPLLHHDAWLRTLQIAARFPRYSPTNQLLIAAAHPEAHYVAGYRTWQTMGRQVLKGSHGIPILAPLIKKMPTDDDPDAKAIVGFRWVTVFDVAQTTGDPDTLPPEPHILSGTSYADALTILRSLSPVPITFVDPHDLHGANGDYHRVTHHIRVRADVDANQQLKTLAHELAHHFGNTEDNTLPRAWEECAAESTAYLFCQSLGFDTADYSAAYIAHWAEANPDTLRTIHTTVLTRWAALQALWHAADAVSSVA